MTGVRVVTGFCAAMASLAVVSACSSQTMPDEALDPAPHTQEEAVSESVVSPTPHDMRVWGIVTDAGYGSHTISTPRSWLFWSLGHDPDAVASIVERQDADWGAWFRGALERENLLLGSANLRSAMADPDSEGLMLVLVTLGAVPAPASGGYEHTLVAGIEEQGDRVIESATLASEGGALVEARIHTARGVSAEPLIVQKRWVIDEVNGFMWGVECVIHESTADSAARTCTDITRSFSAQGPVLRGNQP